ncbi:hypothetical protein G9A89_000248 [Geosiphon pyriformis]|nr:hypothetical protein G9A89_000248 [Geosiphon pyriformis]
MMDIQYTYQGSSLRVSPVGDSPGIVVKSPPNDTKVSPYVTIQPILPLPTPPPLSTYWIHPITPFPTKSLLQQPYLYESIATPSLISYPPFYTLLTIPGTPITYLVGLGRDPYYLVLTVSRAHKRLDTVTVYYFMPRLHDSDFCIGTIGYLRFRVYRLFGVWALMGDMVGVSPMWFEQVLLVCFGYGDLIERLRDIGVSRVYKLTHVWGWGDIGGLGMGYGWVSGRTWGPSGGSWRWWNMGIWWSAYCTGGIEGRMGQIE